MKTLKTSLALLLSLLLAFGLTASVFAAGDGIVLSGTAGDGVTWQLTDDGVLTVSGSGPIVDHKEVEYDEDGSSSVTEFESIGTLIYDYYSAQTAGMSVADAERARFALVREIIVEEGITAVPEDEFDFFYPRKITLPSTLTELGYLAINAVFAEEVVIKSASFPFAQFKVAAYHSGAEPYPDLEAAIDGYIAQQEAIDRFRDDRLPLELLRFVYSIQSGAYAAEEEEIADTLDYYCEAFDAEADSLEDLVPTALALLNAHFGTDYTAPDQIFTVEEAEWGAEVVTDEALQSLVDAEMERVNDTSRLEEMILYPDPQEGYAAYQWLTVTAPGKSCTAENCRIAGVKFVSLDGSEAEGLCQFCGKDHSGNLWQKFVGFVHRILYFFAHLFGMK
jgi:hypothetical protein